MKKIMNRLKCGLPSSTATEAKILIFSTSSRRLLSNLINSTGTGTGGRAGRSKKLISKDDFRIVGLQVYQVDLPLKEGVYRWAGGKSISVFDSTVVKLLTNDKNICGYGEQTPLGSAYLPAHALGTRAGLQEIAKYLIGQNPCNIGNINNVMDKVLKGHNHVKSGIDMACYDILGKVSGLSVCDLLGGRVYGDLEGVGESSLPLYRAISQDTPENMVSRVKEYLAEGYNLFQLKVGGDYYEDIERIKAVRAFLDEAVAKHHLRKKPIPLFCDANTGWQVHEAIRVIRGLSGSAVTSQSGLINNIFIEQPCLTYDECIEVKKFSPFPLILDESIDDLSVLIRAISERSADGINLKISKVGGLTKARLMRDVAVSANIPMIIEDTWGGDIVTASITHLAASTPSRNIFCCTDFNSYGNVDIAETDAKRVVKEDGTSVLNAPKDPGLGVRPLKDVLKKPVFELFE